MGCVRWGGYTNSMVTPNLCSDKLRCANYIQQTKWLGLNHDALPFITVFVLLFQNPFKMWGSTAPFKLISSAAMSVPSSQTASSTSTTTSASMMRRWGCCRESSLMWNVTALAGQSALWGRSKSEIIVILVGLANNYLAASIHNSRSLYWEFLYI